MFWNHQAEGVILAQGMPKSVVNPQIHKKFKTVQYQVGTKVSDGYEEWIVQDTTIFIWLLSIISQFVLPFVLSCKHAFKVLDKIHKYFNVHMKAQVRQLRFELKSFKKGNNSITEYVLLVKATTNLLLQVRDVV